MAIISVTKRWSDPGGGYDSDRRWHNPYFEVLTDNPSTSDKEILAASAGGVSVPKYGESLEGDPFMRCVGADIRERRGPYLTIVAPKYETAPVGSQVDDPLSAPPDVDWDFVDAEVPVDHDRDGKPLCNAAGDLYEDVTETESDLVLNYTRFEASYNAQIAYQYKNKINSDVFLNFPAGTAKCNFIKGRRFYKVAQYFYWQVSYQFQFHEPDWQRVFLNAGRHVLRTQDDGTIAQEMIKYKKGPDKGQVADGPVLLHHSGFSSLQDWMSTAGLSEAIAALGDTKRKFWLKKQIPFAPLNIK